MKFKKLIFLAAFAVTLLVLALAKQHAGGPASVPLKAAGEQASVGSKVAVSDISRLDIYRQKGEDERVTLAKDASGKWTITSRFGTRARKDGVESLLGHLAEIRGEQRSEKKELLADFSITDEKAFHFELSDAAGKALAHRVVSPLRPRGTQNFVREAGSDKVLVTYTDILSDIGIFSDQDRLSYKSFADLRPAGIDSSQVQSFELTPPGKKKLSFTKKQDKDQPPSWSLAEDPSAKIDPGLIQSFFADVFNLYADATADPAAFAKDPFEVWLHAVSGPSDKPQTYDILVGRKDPKEPILRIRASDGLVYELPAAQMDPLLGRTKESFLRKA